MTLLHASVSYKNTRRREEKKIPKGLEGMFERDKHSSRIEVSKREQRILTWSIKNNMHPRHELIYDV